jgi:hypothetical protein
MATPGEKGQNILVVQNHFSLGRQPEIKCNRCSCSHTFLLGERMMAEKGGVSDRKGETGGE